MGNIPVYSEGIAGDGAAILRNGVPMRISEIIAALNESAQPPAQADQLTAADYEEVLADHRRLVRELDVLLNGNGAAQQASLCDIVGQLRAKAQAEPSPDTEQRRRDVGSGHAITADTLLRRASLLIEYLRGADQHQRESACYQLQQVCESLATQAAIEAEAIDER